MVFTLPQENFEIYTTSAVVSETNRKLYYNHYTKNYSLHVHIQDFFPKLGGGGGLNKIEART